MHLRDDLSFPWPAAQAADTGHRHETQSAIDPLGVIVLVCHYDERTGPCQSLACDLAQQQTTKPPVSPLCVRAHQLKASQGAGEEESAAGNQLILMS